MRDDSGGRTGLRECGGRHDGVRGGGCGARGREASVAHANHPRAAADRNNLKRI